MATKRHREGAQGAGELPTQRGPYSAASAELEEAERAILRAYVESRVAADPTTGCWLWAGSLKPNGYGRANFLGRGMYAHRASWLVFRGAIPAGFLVLHRCDVRCCVAPGHLWLGDQSANIRDMHAKGRAPPPAPKKLTAEHVRDIRAALRYGVPQQWVAVEFGVCQQTVSEIARGLIWRQA